MDGPIGRIGFLNSQKRPQAMSNAMAMVMNESCKRNGNGRAMGVQCVHAMPLPLHGNGSNLPQQSLEIGLPGPHAAAKSSTMETSC
jgi:hypothetical protein